MGTSSKHAKGIALDFVIVEPVKSQSVETKLKIIEKELNIELYILNEYLKPSKRSTGVIFMLI